MKALAQHSRRKWQYAVVAGIVSVLAGALVLQSPSAQTVDSRVSVPRLQGPVSFADVVDAVSPAVVDISVQKVSRTGFSDARGQGMGPSENMPFNEFFDRFFGAPGGPAMPRERRSQALGSGFIISPDGYVVTNNHVISDASDVMVILEGGDELPADIVGADTRTDLALLKVSYDEDLPYVEFGDSDAARVGEWVLAIGNPFGFGGSATAGIISARGRDIRSGPYDDYLQIDAPINSGNSGGPVFNGAGEVIGINTAIISPNGGNIGIGLAIPAAQARPVIESLMNNGSVTRGWLGVQIQDLDEDLAAAVGADDGMGALVADVDSSGPAAAGGVEAGDVIREVAGHRIENSRHLSRVIADSDPGRRVDIEVLRDGRTRDLSVTLGDLDRAGPRLGANQGRDRQGGAPSFGGLSLDELTQSERASLGIPAGVDGVIVRRVEPDSEAAAKGIRPGDVITSIDRQKVGDLADAWDALDAAQSSDEPALLVLRRGESQRYVALPLG
jgi:serine protease Do